jgi:hypothetical protein
MVLKDDRLDISGAIRDQFKDITDTGHGAFLDAFRDRHQRVRDSKKGAV